MLDGGSGVDTMFGGTGDDTYYADVSGDKVYEGLGEGTDTVIASADFTLADKANVENLTLVNAAISGTGNTLANRLIGNANNNILSAGAGNDYIDGGSGADSMTGGTGDDTYVVDNAGDSVTENAGEGNDSVLASVTYALASNVENLSLTGTANINGTGNELANTLSGNSGNNVLSGGAGNDSLDGGGGDDLLNGDAGDDKLEGRSGFDVLRGGDGNDALHQASGIAVLSGGVGTDSLINDAPAAFLVGEKGNDTVVANGSASVIAFNKGDGQDLVSLRSTGNATLSLGGGTAYQDLTLRQSGQDLVFELGNGDSMTLQGWYDGTQTKPNAVTLQMIAQAIQGFNPGGPDPLLNQRIETFDFKQLAGAFDAERAADPTINRWSAMHRLLDVQLAGSDTAALGGELAYDYGMNGTLTGMALGGVQDTLKDPAFAKQAQSITSASQNTQPVIKLG